MECSILPWARTKEHKPGDKHSSRALGPSSFPTAHCSAGIAHIPPSLFIFSFLPATGIFNSEDTDTISTQKMTDEKTNSPSRQNSNHAFPQKYQWFWGHYDMVGWECCAWICVTIPPNFLRADRKERSRSWLSKVPFACYRLPLTMSSLI